MQLLRGEKQKLTLGAEETAAILLGSGRETKPQYDAKNLTIFE
jgi:hypothetical protein